MQLVSKGTLAKLGAIVTGVTGAKKGPIRKAMIALLPGESFEVLFEDDPKISKKRQLRRLRQMAEASVVMGEGEFTVTAHYDENRDVPQGAVVYRHV